MTFGIAMRPRSGSSVCGDAYLIDEAKEDVLICVVDGLGHGMEAREVAEAAVAYIARHRGDDLQQIVRGCHRALNRTRGVVMGLARINGAGETLMYAGVGNVGVRVCAQEGSVRPVTMPGIVGANLRTVRVETYPFRAGDILLMHSDGITSGFEWENNPVLRGLSAQGLADRILDLYGKGHDDALVIVAM